MTLKPQGFEAKKLKRLVLEEMDEQGEASKMPNHKYLPWIYYNTDRIFINKSKFPQTSYSERFIWS